jgi:hypothetical protein
MFYYTPDKRKVHIFNKTPINLSRGGLIPHFEEIRPQDYNDDTIYSILEVGSLIIPRPVVDGGFMDEFLQEHNIYQDEVKDPKDLTVAVVMPREIVIPKKLADKAKVYLKQRGITLPLPKRD